jgi:hypothetical protein
VLFGVSIGMLINVTKKSYKLQAGLVHAVCLPVHQGYSSSSKRCTLIALLHQGKQVECMLFAALIFMLQQQQWQVRSNCAASTGYSLLVLRLQFYQIRLNCADKRIDVCLQLLL